jgi:hypothetical protein
VHTSRRVPVVAIIFGLIVIIFGLIVGSATASAQTPSCPSSTAATLTGTVGPDSDVAVPINLAPCETVSVQIDISDSPPAYPYLSFTMYDAVGDSIYSNGWTTDSGSQLHPFGAPWIPPWRGTRGMEGLPLRGTFHVGYTYFGRLVNYTITVTKMPRPGYNLGGTGFDNATLIPVGLRYYGSLVPAEAGQFYRVHLEAGETITVSGFAEGHPSYGSYFSITLFDPSRQPISPDLMDVAAYGPVYFTGGTYTNTGGAGDFYVRIKTTYWPTHDFNFVLKDVGGPDVTFLDPVDELLSGPRVTTDSQVLATRGREVEGIGADGVSQVVLRIQVPTGTRSP